MSERKQAWIEGAGIVLDAFLESNPTLPRSAADFGCGPGAWLAALAKRGTADLIGYDLKPPDPAVWPGRFEMCDLTQPMIFHRRFDLALCLEVGEHLPKAAAWTLVNSLAEASDVILFSAAIPGQGGDGHCNENWPSFWVELFAEHGYASLDLIRPRIWTDERVLWWYRNNAFVVYSVKAHASYINCKLPGATVRDMAHPLCYDSARRMQTKTP
jgi:SAM-dependent methyltransferase